MAQSRACCNLFNLNQTMLCAKCGKEPIVHDLMIGQRCLEALQKNPETLLKERKLPVEPELPKPGGGGGMPVREYFGLAASAK